MQLTQREKTEECPVGTDLVFNKAQRNAELLQLSVGVIIHSISGKVTWWHGVTSRFPPLLMPIHLCKMSLQPTISFAGMACVWKMLPNKEVRILENTGQFACC